MGECLISRRGGEAYTLPILNASYPQDVTVTASTGGTSGFSVSISEHGRPVEYTYQWYVNGSAVSGATSSTYTRSTVQAGTYTIYCDVTNKAGTVSSRIATLTVYSTLPTYSYNGTASVSYEDSNKINWKMKLLSGGTLIFDRDVTVDVFMVGGGGAGGCGWYSSAYSAGGGGSGKSNTQKRISLTAGKQYPIVVGAGGSGMTGDYGSSGGQSSALGFSADGGTGGHVAGENAAGGTGGAAGGAGGAGNGRAGGAGCYEFNDTSLTQYAGGGGSGGGNGCIYGAGGAGGGGNGGSSYFYIRDHGGNGSGTAGKTNTGSGGGGAGAQQGGNSDGGGVEYTGGAGGSGIVIIRNAR